MALMRLGIIFAAVVAFGAMQGRVCAQSPPRPRFDVASVKPSPIIGGGIATDESSNPRGITIRGVTPKELILRAYRLKAYQVSVPGWLEEEHYDIVARTSDPVSGSVQRLMLQDMLAARFQLAVHFETKLWPCYELLVAENGLKVHQVAPDSTGTRIYGRKQGILAEQTSMSLFADLLSQELDRPVLDKTGISGVFDFDVKWAALSAEPEAEAGPSVFAAIQTLGLKLEPRKSPIHVLVIDRVARPGPN